MEISQQAKARMVDLLRPMLAKAMVDTDGDLDFDFYEECQALERIPPEKVQNQLNAMAGEQPISQILFDQIEREIGERSSAEEEVPLTSLPGFEDPEAAAVRLIESLASLPRSYTLTVRMPTQLGLLFEDDSDVLELAERIVLRQLAGPKDHIRESERRADPEGPVLAQELVKAARRPSRDVVLDIELTGYATRFNMTPVVADALEEAQAFVGSLVAHRLLHVSPLGQLFETERDHSFLVTERNNGAERLVMKGRHSIDFARRFAGGMRLATLRRTDRPDDRTEVRAEVVRLAKMLDKENGHRRHAGLVLGAKWLLDSYLGNDRILSYVQATVALETLLGDKAESDVVGIGALLANRCAYMLATSVVERRELLSSIKEIYRVRSKIVHEGQSRLAESQQYRLNQLRRICGRVIEHETKLIGP